MMVESKRAVSPYLDMVSKVQKKAFAESPMMRRGERASLLQGRLTPQMPVTRQETEKGTSMQ